MASITTLKIASFPLPSIPLPSKGISNRYATAEPLQHYRTGLCPRARPINVWTTHQRNCRTRHGRGAHFVLLAFGATASGSRLFDRLVHSALYDRISLHPGLQHPLAAQHATT